MSDFPLPCYVNFRDLGDDPQGGGFLLVTTQEERAEFSAQCRALDLKVEWSECG